MRSRLAGRGTIQYIWHHGSSHMTTPTPHMYLCIFGSAVLIKDFFEDRVVSQFRVVEVTREHSLDSHTIYCTHTVRGDGKSQYL